jgi:hypothetical protein
VHVEVEVCSGGEAVVAACVMAEVGVTPGFLKNKTRLIICVPRKSTHISE